MVQPLLKGGMNSELRPSVAGGELRKWGGGVGSTQRPPHHTAVSANPIPRQEHLGARHRAGLLSGEAG